MIREDRTACRILVGGIFALAVALGIGRFAYTPLLPLMQRDIRFGDDFAGFLASANYAGYLVGALRAVWTARRKNRLRRLRIHLAFVVAGTLGMGLTAHPIAWMGLRFLSGVTSALVFILASGIVLSALAELRRTSWSGWLYSGVGAGITLSAILVPALDDFAGWRGGWLGLGGVGAMLALGAGKWISGEISGVSTNPARREPDAPGTPGMLPWLTLAYGCEGLGYIVTGTFLVALLERASGSANMGIVAWLAVGLASIPSCILWIRVGMKLGLAGTLILAHLVQAFGILLPILFPSLWGAVGAGAFFGGTFVGISALSLVLGRSLAPEHSDRVIATLTAAFGTGQMIGPAIAGTLANHTRSFALPIFCAAAVVALGAGFLAIGLVRARNASGGFVPTKP